MVSNFILRIENEKGEILISAQDARQEIYPCKGLNVTRNLNSVPIKTSEETKLKCSVEFNDSPDISILRAGGIFKVFSVIKFKQHKGAPLDDGKVVDGSIKENGDYIEFRPVLEVLLTNFSCKAGGDGNAVWKLEFEEF